eukprot:3510326-Amphidinium_carterae.2
MANDQSRLLLNASGCEMRTTQVLCVRVPLAVALMSCALRVDHLYGLLVCLIVWYLLLGGLATC